MSVISLGPNLPAAEVPVYKVEQCRNVIDSKLAHCHEKERSDCTLLVILNSVS